MSIDWSKAPEGFPLWLEDIRPNVEGYCRSGWVRQGKGEYEFLGGGWWTISHENTFYKIHNPPAHAKTWTGEGLPPVGQHVHIYDPEGVLMYGAGEDGEVIAHVEDTAVVRMSYGLGCFVAKHLRTAVQIAAEERKTEIAEIENLIMNHWETLNVHDLAATIYEANYRKVTP